MTEAERVRFGWASLWSWFGSEWEILGECLDSTSLRAFVVSLCVCVCLCSYELVCICSSTFTALDNRHSLEKMVSWVFLRCEDHSAFLAESSRFYCKRKCASRLCSHTLCTITHLEPIRHQCMLRKARCPTGSGLRRLWRRKLRVPRKVCRRLCVCACIFSLFPNFESSSVSNTTTHWALCWFFWGCFFFQG